MMKEQDSVRLLAGRIARRISQGQDDSPRSGRRATGEGDDELAMMRSRLDELQKRLSHLEAHVGHEEDEPASGQGGSRRSLPGEESRASEPGSGSRSRIQSPWLSGMYVPATHPSQDKFGVREATISELVDFFENEKTCGLEPGGKPCDHCAMCSSRGF